MALPRITLGQTRRVVPGPGLPPDLEVQRANNNLDVVHHDGRVFLAFRTAPYHFASPKSRLHVLSSDDAASSWRWEATFARGRDLREPRLLSWNDRLLLYFFQAGSSPFSFSPERIYASERLPTGEWTEPRPISEEGYVVWRTKVTAPPSSDTAPHGSQTGRPFMVRYSGGREVYSLRNVPPRMRVELLTTDDGYSWYPVDSRRPVVYEGGGSEADFAFDGEGNLWAVIRNESGDAGGYGSKICRARAGSLAEWECRDDPRKFDSPLVFEHSGEVYLIARRNLSPLRGGAFDLGWRFLPSPLEWALYELAYWLTPKRSALYLIDRNAWKVVHVLDFPSRGDTAFPALLRLDSKRYLVFDYSSDIDGFDRPWLIGQLGPTAIYATELRFES